MKTSVRHKPFKQSKTILATIQEKASVQQKREIIRQSVHGSEKVSMASFKRAHPVFQINITPCQESLEIIKKYKLLKLTGSYNSHLGPLL